MNAAFHHCSGCALEGLLQGLASVAKETSEELGPNASQDQLVSHAVKVNVFNSMNFLLKLLGSAQDDSKMLFWGCIRLK